MNKTVRIFLSVSLVLSLLPAGAFAQTPASLDAPSLRYGRKEWSGGEIMKILHVYTDLYGPRLTGSPQLKAAGDWSVKKMLEWGFDKAEMEPWDFGIDGWTNERASGFIVEPVQDSLVTTRGAGVP